MKYTKKEIEDVLDTISDDIIKRYQNYDKYNYMTIHILLKYSRASIISKLIKEKELKLVKEYMKYYSKSDLLEMFIYYFFDDIPYNFLINLKEMLKYMNINPKFKPVNLALYNQILNFNNLSINDIKVLFHKYKDKHCASIFYNDYRLARNLSYEELNSKLMNIKRDITYLNGEEFYLCIHSSNSCLWNNNANVISLSLISYDNISHYCETRKYIYGFSKLKIDHIINMYHADSYSSYTYGTDKVQRITSPKQFMLDTESYNEIFYKLDCEFDPDLLICYDFVTKEQMMVAKDNNLKLVVINSKKYPQKKGFEKILVNNYVDENTYNNLSNYEILEEIKR